ncbi:Transposase [Fibrobacter intestinalis]|uniref:Transposase n=1 Tax=Fibrobacter intestinalis TaxID=28122 RepID=A0A1M6T827_9BACT|nr:MULTISPECIES: transposase [Fibrobacter]SHK53135.1 Transposase [Fibrobacter intestinalis]
MPYYSLSQIAKALKTYHELRSVSRTVQVLGYPTRARLYFWIHEEGKVKTRKRKYSYKNIREHPRNPSANIKLEAIRRCFENGENVVDVAEGLGYSTASIYKWRRLYLTKGALALQSCNRKKPRGPLEEGKDDFSSAEVSALNRKVRDLEMEVAILKETLNILKKDPGVDVSALNYLPGLTCPAAYSITT